MGIRKTLLIASTALVVPLAVQAGTLGSKAAHGEVATTLSNQAADTRVLLHDAAWWNEGNENVKDWWNGKDRDNERGERGDWNERGERGDWDERGERGNWWNESGESGRHNWWNKSGEAGEQGKKHKKNKWSKKWDKDGEHGERGHSWWDEGGERWD